MKKNNKSQTDNPDSDFINNLEVNSTSDKTIEGSSYINKDKEREIVEKAKLEKDIPNLNSSFRNNFNKKGFFALSAIVVSVLLILFFSSSTKKTKVKDTDSTNQSKESVSVDDSPLQPMLSTKEEEKEQEKPIEVITKTVEPSHNNAPTINPRLELRLEDKSDLEVGIPKEQMEQKNERIKATKIKSKKTLLLEGTYIRCVLNAKIVSSTPGPTSCVITENIYSADGNTLLIPKGSKALGIAGGVSDDRVAVMWNRIITPNYFNIQLNSFGTDNMGAIGHPGHVKTQFFKQLASSIMISIIGDAVDVLGEKYKRDTVVQTNVGVTTAPTETKTAETLQNMAESQLSKYQNLNSIITINQGTIINIYVSKDVDFSGVIAYD